MTIGRRHLIQAAALCALPAASAQAARPLGATVLPMPASGSNDVHGLVFRVRGWDSPGETGSEALASQHAWLGISPSWRATWR